MMEVLSCFDEASLLYDELIFMKLCAMIPVIIIIIIEGYLIYLC